MTNFDQMKLAVEGLSGGKNTIILDDVEMPSYMVRIPRMKYSDVITGATQDILDAFYLNGNPQDVLYIGKYQSFVINGRAYSLPFKDPAVSMNFDTARAYCRNKGSGWHLTTNALWAAIALWCKKNGAMPGGNNNYGQDSANAYEKGVPSMARDGSGRVLRTATGSGPNRWYHDYDSATGIADMNGNVWEWCGGLRLVGGEIQIIPYGNAMADIYAGAQDIQSATSGLWKAILQDGSFVDPGTPGTLKLDYANSKITLTAAALTAQSDTQRSTNYELLGLHSNVTSVPQVLHGLGLYPVVEETGYMGDNVWMNNCAGLECLPIRGGCWRDGAGAGVFALHVGDPRSYAATRIGFRPAFCGNL